MAQTWTDWIDPGVSYFFNQERATVYYRWRVEQATSGDVLTQAQALAVPNVTSQPIAPGSATPFGVYSESRIVVSGTAVGQQFGTGWSGANARAAFVTRMPEPPFGTVSTEYESDLATITSVLVKLGASRSFAPQRLSVTNYVRTTSWTDLTQPRAYDVSGDNLWSYDAGDPGGVAFTDYLDVTSHADPVTGDFVVKSASVVNSLGPPSPDAEASAMVTWNWVGARYVCQAPRVRYLVDDFAVDPPPEPVIVYPSIDGSYRDSRRTFW